MSELEQSYRDRAEQLDKELENGRARREALLRQINELNVQMSRIEGARILLNEFLKPFTKSEETK